MKYLNVLLKALLTGLAVLSMAATGCEEEEQPLPKPQGLRRIVEVGKINARPVQLPGGEIFDLEFVVNQQFPDILVTSQEFALSKRRISTGGEGVSPKDDVLASRVGVQAQKWIPSKEAECLVNLPQWRLGGSVNSYEWVSGGGLRVGYTPAGDNNTTSIGGSVHFDKAELNLTLRAHDPVDDMITKAANINQDQLKTQVSFDITFGQFSIGPEFYYQKGLAQVTKEALEKALTALRAQTDTTPWYSRIGYREEGYAVMVGGDNIGVQVGDTFTIHNSQYFWEGDQVCDPNFYNGRLDGPAMAQGVVVEVGDKISRIKIDDSTIGREDPLTGSVVKVLKLNPR